MHTNNSVAVTFWPLKEVNLFELIICEVAHFVLQHLLISGHFKKIIWVSSKNGVESELLSESET